MQKTFVIKWNMKLKLKKQIKQFERDDSFIFGGSSLSSWSTGVVLQTENCTPQGVFSLRTTFQKMWFQPEHCCTPVVHQNPPEMFREQLWDSDFYFDLNEDEKCWCSHPTCVCNFWTFRAGTNHAAGDDRLQVVEGWRVALLSVDDSHVGVHQHVRHLIGHVVRFPPSRHHATRTTSRILNSLGQLQGFHCFGLFYWLFKLEKREKKLFICKT